MSELKLRRPLTPAEQEGWRYSWDGWSICPACIAKTMSKPEHAERNGEWPVPADYDHRGIKDDARCVSCGLQHQKDTEHG